MSRAVIGVVGPGENAQVADLQNAYQLGQTIAQQNWILLTGGRNAGVMQAASQGAQTAGGFVVGILPTSEPEQASPDLDLAICTGLGQARNVINVLSSHVIIACGCGAGTTSEIAIALKHQKPVILLAATPTTVSFFRQLGATIYAVATVEAAIERTQQLIAATPAIRVV